MIRKKQWKDMTRSQQISLAVMGMIQLLLLATALWDIRQRPATQINGSKGWWTAAVFINFFGPIAYFLFGKKSES